MSSEDKEIVKELSEMCSDLTDAAIKFREEAPGLSYLLWQYTKTAKKVMERMRPVRRDQEGGGGSWFALCEECRGQVGQHDAYCRHCGRALED